MKIGAMLATGALTLALVLSSCASAPKEISQDLSAEELIQRAQEASDTYNYAAAIAYYRALDERYGTEPSLKATADYEIAFIAYKEGRYAEAQIGFEELLLRYQDQKGSALPERFKILSEKLLVTIKEKRGQK